MKASEIITALNADVDDAVPGQYRALCPAHEVGRSDVTSPSLILSFTDDKKALVVCQSRGCSFRDIIRPVGLAPSDMFDVAYIGQTVRAAKAPNRAATDASLALSARAYNWSKALAEEVTGNPGGDLARMLAERFGLEGEVTLDLADDLGIGYDAGDDALTILARNVKGGAAFVQKRALHPTSKADRWKGEPNPDKHSRWDAAGFIGRMAGDRPVIVCEGMTDGVTLAVLDAYDVVSVRGAQHGLRIAEVEEALMGRPVYIAADADASGGDFEKLVTQALRLVAQPLHRIKLPRGTDVTEFRSADPATFTARFASLVEAAEVIEPEIIFDIDKYIWAGATDLDQARALLAFARAQGLDFAWTPAKGWLIFDGQVWSADAEAKVRQVAHRLMDFVKREAGKVWINDQDRGRQLLYAAKGFGMNSTITRTLLEMAAMADVHREMADFDANPDLLAVANGVIDLRTGTLLPFQKAQRITKRLAVAYRPGALAPRWSRFLSEVLVDDNLAPALDVINWMHHLVGYAITGHTSEQMFALFLGTGANGKSVFIDVLRNVFHAYAQMTPFSTFEAKPAGGIPNDLAALRGARLVFASESDIKATMSEATLKAVTGGDSITVRFMRKEFFTFKPEFQLFLASNKLPKFLGQDNGLWRRVKLVHWRREFSEDEWDRTLTQTLIGEAEGILAWAVEGAKAWYTAGRCLPLSPTVQAASRTYKRESDVLGEFIEYNVEQTGDQRDVVFHDDLRMRYREWNFDRGERADYGKVTFGRMLDERWGIRPSQTMPAHHKGYRLRAPNEVAKLIAQKRGSVFDGVITGASVDEVLEMLSIPEPKTAAKYKGKYKLPYDLDAAHRLQGADLDAVI